MRRADWRRDAETPISIVTQSALIPRARVLLTDLAQGPEAIVYFTVTTLDAGLWRSSTPPPLKRLRVMRRLRAACVPYGFFVALVLTGTTDSLEFVHVVAASAKAYGVLSFGSSELRLTTLVKEHYSGLMAAMIPELFPCYERTYAGTTVSWDTQTAIEQYVAWIREHPGFTEDAMRELCVNVDDFITCDKTVSDSAGQLALPLWSGGSPDSASLCRDRPYRP